MKEIQILHEYEEFTTGEIVRDTEIGYLIAPGIAVLGCSTNTLYFVNVRPMYEGGDLYEMIGDIADINVMNSAPLDIKSMPAEALTFALWAAGNVEPAVVAV